VAENADDSSVQSIDDTCFFGHGTSLPYKILLINGQRRQTMSR
jgi:hypothetical protein